MKKNNVIIPAVCIALSITAMLTMTLLSTSALFFYSHSKNTYNHETDELAVFRETHKVMETVVKFDPNSLGNTGSTLELNNCKGWLPWNYECSVPLKVTGTLYHLPSAARFIGMSLFQLKPSM